MWCLTSATRYASVQFFLGSWSAVLSVQHGSDWKLVNAGLVAIVALPLDDRGSSPKRFQSPLPRSINHSCTSQMRGQAQFNYIEDQTTELNGEDDQTM